MADFTIPNISNEEFFQRFGGPAAFLLWNGSTVQIVSHNSEYVSEMSLECASFENIDLLSVIDEQDREPYRSALVKAVETGEPQSCESGRHGFSQLCGALNVYVKTRLSIVEKLPEGALLHASVRNITNEMEQRETADSDRRFRYAAEQANMYAWEYDIATKQMRPCYRCMRDLNLPPLLENYPEPAIEAGIFPQDYADLYRDWHRQLAAGVEKLEGIIPLTPARVPFHVRYSTVFNGEGKPVKAYGSATQVVSSEAEQDYRDIVSCLGKAYFGLYYIDLTNGDFRQLDETKNATTAQIIGESGKASDAFLRMCKHLVVPTQAEEVLRFTDYTTLADRLENTDSIGIHFRGPHITWCEGMFVAVKRDAAGRCTHVIWGVRSIMEQKQKEDKQRQELAAALQQTEEALEEAKRANAARNSFLSRMSHDIRTPLNGIIGLMEISDRHPDDIELQNANRAKAKVAANHLLALISDVLELSKMDDRNVQLADEAFDIAAMADDVYTIAGLRASENGINIRHFEHDTFERYPYVFGSPLHVKQLMLNIIGNAIKYNNPGGNVDISVSAEPLSESYVCYTISVADTGIGMSPEFLEKIYEPFSQERVDARSVFNGTGLGMAIVKSLVEKMGGSIDVKSTKGVGTVFTIALPFRLAEQRDLPAPVEHREADVSGARVLVAEDNELNMEIIVSILEEEFGVAVTQATNGREAVDIYASSTPGSFDLILMDIMMPVLDGYGATDEIRALPASYCDIPIVAMTANAFADDVRRCLDHGMNGHLAKPVDIPKLLAVIEQYKK